MEQLSDLLSRLPDRHRLALEWFVSNAEKETPWPRPLKDGTKLASKAKGIYKPQWSQYSLSIRQSLNSRYPDREPTIRPDGTWSYFYFQENINPDERDSEYTNRGLFSCWRDAVPVGVMRQVSNEPRATYKILGLALVAGWAGGYFILEGFASDGRSRGRGNASDLSQFLAAAEANERPAFGLQTIADARERILAAIVRRRGQPQFRQMLLAAYVGRCAITGCDATEALEAAHIIPYFGPDSDHPANGLLLRADIHTLFDIGLIAIDTATMSVLLSPGLAGTAYHTLAGAKLRLPKEESLTPSKEALDQHRVWSGL